MKAAKKEVKKEVAVISIDDTDDDDSGMDSPRSIEELKTQEDPPGIVKRTEECFFASSSPPNSKHKMISDTSSSPSDELNFEAIRFRRKNFIL